MLSGLETVHFVLIPMKAKSNKNLLEISKILYMQQNQIGETIVNRCKDTSFLYFFNIYDNDMNPNSAFDNCGIDLRLVINGLQKSLKRFVHRY